jgi:hypothetical protein
MPSPGNTRRLLLLALAAIVLFLPSAAATLRNSSSPLGLSLRQNIVQAEEPEVPTDVPPPPTDVPAEVVVGAEAPTDEGGEPPTDIPTEIPTEAPTEIPTEAPTLEPTEAPTEVSTDVPTPSPEPTDAATELPTETPTESPDSEATEEAQPTVEPTMEVTPEETVEPTPESTAEFTPEATAEPAVLALSAVCVEAGTEFTVTNSGGTMQQPEVFFIDNAPKGDFQLAADESTIIAAGYGQPILTAAGLTAQPQEPCTPPPVLEVTSAVCVPYVGVVFTITNSGGPMLAAQVYSITDLPDAEFQLGEGESIEIEAGYGSPGLTAGDLVAQVEDVCNPLSNIGGAVWLDANLNAVRESDETGIPNAIVTLTDAFGESQAVLTAEDGTYQFVDIVVGDYTLVVTTSPESLLLPIADLDGGEDGAVFLTLDRDPISADFGFQPLGQGTISGRLWLDTSDFGTRDTNETGIAGITLQLHNADGAFEQTYTVEADGVYTFVDLLPGTYTLSIDDTTLPERMFVTYNFDGTRQFTTTIHLEADADVTDVEFGLVGTF